MLRVRANGKGLLLLILGITVALQAQGLPVELVQAWNEYVHLTENRIERELGSTQNFLVQDFQASAQAKANRERLLGGKLVVTRMRTDNPDGQEMEVPGGMIHHWRGAILIPGVTLDEVLDAVRHPEVRRHRQEDVLESRVLGRTDDSVHVYLKLVRSKIVTVTYNTEHLVHYRRHGPGRASSRTTATKVAELADAGTLHEREKPQGEDRGFMWRLNSYWRYEQVEGGVLVECESLTLSRSIPSVVAPLVRPIVDSVAKESMGRTLSSMRERFANVG